VETSNAAMDELLKEVDRDGSGEVEYTEFVEIMTSSLRDLSETKPKKSSKKKPSVQPDFAMLATAYRRRKILEAISSSDKVKRTLTLEKANRDYQEAMRRAEESDRPKQAAKKTEILKSVQEQLDGMEARPPSRAEERVRGPETVVVSPTNLSGGKGGGLVPPGARAGQRASQRPHSSASHYESGRASLRKRQFNHGPRMPPRPASQQGMRPPPGEWHAESPEPPALQLEDFPRISPDAYRWERVSSPVWRVEQRRMDDSWWPRKPTLHGQNLGSPGAGSRCPTPLGSERPPSRATSESLDRPRLRQSNNVQPRQSYVSAAAQVIASVQKAQSFRSSPTHGLLMQMPAPPQTRTLHLNNYAASSGPTHGVGAAIRPHSVSSDRLRAANRELYSPLRSPTPQSPSQVPRYYFGVNSVQELVPSSSSSRTASASNDHPARIDRSRHMHMGAQETRGVSVRVSGQAPPKRSLKNTRAHNAFTHQTSLSGWDGVVNLEAISPGRSFTESREAK